MTAAIVQVVNNHSVLNLYRSQITIVTRLPCKTMVMVKNNLICTEIYTWGMIWGRGSRIFFYLNYILLWLLHK